MTAAQFEQLMVGVAAAFLLAVVAIGLTRFVTAFPLG